MDCSEATNIVLTKIKSMDPENASKIMGFLLISLEESELLRLCCSPDHVLHSLILRAKSQLGLSSNSSTSSAIPSPPSPLNPIARPTVSNPFSQSSPRIGDNGFDFGRNPSSPSSHSWVFPGLPNSPISPNSSTLLSYKNIRAGFPNDPTNTVKDFVDEHQMNDYLSFLNESSSKNEDLVDPQLQSAHGVNNWQSVNNGDVVPFHRRCFSASDVCFEPEEAGPGIGQKLCLYYARGHCKNGNNCKFVHGILPDSLEPPIVGSPNRFEGFEQREEFMRLKVAIQQRMIASSRLTTGVSPSSHDQYLNFLMQQQSDPQSQRAAAALMMGEEFIPFGRGRMERNDFSAMVSAERLNSASRQIYLTFPAESTFKDEDVSDYFSQFGPVQDVRIPYQQKRMFGFVTFVYPETVRMILAKGNPHFICDSRVLVKPYKEKGKAPEKRQQHQQQQFDRGDFSPSLSPMGFDSKEPYDHLGARVFYSPQEILFRRQLEQHELQKAIELQGRRLMNLQLPDFKNNPVHNHHRSLSVGSSPPIPQPNSNISNAVLTPDSIQGDITGYSGTQAPTISLPTTTLAEMQQKQEEVNPACIHDNVGGNKKENTNTEALDKNLEQVLPDSLSASPTNAAGDLPDSSTLPDANERATFSTSSFPRNSELPAKSADTSSS